VGPTKPRIPVKTSVYRAYRVLVGKSEGKRPIGRPRRRWEDNIEMDIQEVEWGTWTGFIWLRIGQEAGTCECGNEPTSSIKCGEFLEWLRTVSFSRSLLHGDSNHEVVGSL
jgi:hypothetical protein